MDKTVPQIEQKDIFWQFARLKNTDISIVCYKLCIPGVQTIKNPLTILTGTIGDL